MPRVCAAWLDSVDANQPEEIWIFMPSGRTFISIPIAVQAFKYGHDVFPTWFDDFVKAGKTSDRNPLTSTIYLHTRGGLKARLDVGMMVVKDDSGNIWPAEEKDFFKIFREVVNG